MLLNKETNLPINCIWSFWNSNEPVFSLNFEMVFSVKPIAQRMVIRKPFNQSRVVPICKYFVIIYVMLSIRTLVAVFWACDKLLHEIHLEYLTVSRIHFNFWNFVTLETRYVYDPLRVEFQAVPLQSFQYFKKTIPLKNIFSICR